MASDRRQFERAYLRWQELYTAEQFSVPDDVGITAVMASNFPFNYKRNGDSGIADDESDIAEFQQEARDLCEHLGDFGLPTELFLGATALDLQDVLQDTEVSSIILIGHGSISDIFMQGAKGDRFDWRDVSAAASHLKSGYFIQRQCGIFRRHLNVPLGYFAVSDQRRVRAAVGEIFEPINYADLPGALMPVVEDNDTIGSYREMSELFVVTD